MSTFDPNNPEQGSSRERPEPGDPEARFYPPYTSADSQQQGHQNYSGYGYGCPPDMDPDGFARYQGGWQGRPGWQPWAGGGFYYRRRRFPFWGVLLLIVLAILLIKPVLTFTFALAGLAFVILLFALPFAILGMLLRHHYGRGWGGGWGRWHRW